jgi:GxxExxY protein
MTENQIATIVVGPGLLESVYEAALELELKNRGLRVDKQIGIPVIYDGVQLDVGFRCDLIVDGSVIVEIRSVESVPSVAYKIVRTYLRLTGLHLGLLINFNEVLIKNGIKRVVDNLPE